MLEAIFTISHETPTYMYIVDTGTAVKSVTNDVKNVLTYLSEHYNLGCRRLIYRDSTGQDDEILHDKGVFKGFKPGHVGINDLYATR